VRSACQAFLLAPSVREVAWRRKHQFPATQPILARPDRHETNRVQHPSRPIGDSRVEYEARHRRTPLIPGDAGLAARQGSRLASQGNFTAPPKRLRAEHRPAHADR
jgi:hypothetical protein